MASPFCSNAAAGARAGHGLPLRRHGSPPSSAPVALRRHILPTRGPALSLRCAGADWSEPAFVTVAEKLDAAAAARNARVFAGAGGEEEKGRVEAISGVSSGVVEEPVAVPFAPLEQSLVPVDTVGDGTLSQMLSSKLGFFEGTSTYAIYGAGAFFAGWILSAIVSALDSIPLLPKILEIVGLGYTIWFGTRYLLFKENRDELLIKIDDLKRRIVGSGEE
ncbi:hypothetical protein HU200_005615 [Digitaria exilis]|uniref:Cyanobacterial aminoacyl-tRNA synthetase CAAD domain-containing protein n=1 Tax=Digitaria exilis TaxID=1010633 RepID=A0A835FRH1_9POAL|nr:hypothetical protein HU200_005615 [Digitaria exilis]CAB3470007.1 unnamed protein product [Digitaria exilis]